MKAISPDTGKIAEEEKNEGKQKFPLQKMRNVLNIYLTSFTVSRSIKLEFDASTNLFNKISQLLSNNRDTNYINIAFD